MHCHPGHAYPRDLPQTGQLKLEICLSGSASGNVERQRTMRCIMACLPRSRQMAQFVKCGVVASVCEHVCQPKRLPSRPLFGGVETDVPEAILTDMQSEDQIWGNAAVAVARDLWPAT